MTIPEQCQGPLPQRSETVIGRSRKGG